MEDKAKILLHACCAPCSSAILEYLLKNDMPPTIFFSNSNIYPKEEYIKRRDECLRYAKELGVEFVEDDYNHEAWLETVRGLEQEPERGNRCLACFKHRLQRAAAWAEAHGHNVLTTTLASSRWKSLDQVNHAGKNACSLHPEVEWWEQNWRKNGLQERRNQIIKERNFYNQLYCGCEFSFRK